MQSVAKSIGAVTRGLEAAMAAMDLEKIAKIMDQFQKQFADLDVKTGVMEGSMSSAMTLSTPQADVDALVKQVADENGLEIMAAVADAPGTSGLTIGAPRARVEGLGGQALAAAGLAQKLDLELALLAFFVWHIRILFSYFGNDVDLDNSHDLI